MMKRIRAGIIGCGMISKMFHVPAMTHIPEIKLEAFSDVNGEWANELANRYSAPYSFTDYNEMIGKIDMVVVATPNALHTKISKVFLDAGVHVLCEKPMGINVEECEDVLKKETESNALFMVGHSRRFASNAMLLKEFHEKGMFGEIKSMELVMGHSHTQWITRSGFSFKKELSGGGVLIDQGIHLIDLLIWFSPGQIAVTSSVGKDILGHGMEDHAEIEFSLSNGGKATIKTSRIEEWDNLCTLEGTKGWAKFHIDDKSFLKICSENLRGCRKLRHLQVKTGLNNIYLDQIKYFVNCINKNVSPMTSAGSAVKGIRLLKECYDKMSIIK